MMTKRCMAAIAAGTALALFGPMRVNAQSRSLDPVVLTGAALADFAGQPPQSIVGFRYRNGWQQIPVQIDERAVVSFAQIRQRASLTASTLVYTDPLTWTGADPNATFDADDELVFMAKDVGTRTTAADPAGVVVGSGRAIAVVDPIGRPTGTVYLFRSAGTLRPDAGVNYADYAFRLTSGNYKQTFNLGGNNPEQSTGGSSRYTIGLTDSWILDELRVTAGNATGVDILDRHKFGFAPGNCNRTTDTFSAGGGAFIANKDGPVRGIRSVVGSNSGVINQRDWLFYEGRLDIVNYLRVHAIRSMFDYTDWSPAATGMTYYDNVNPGGVTIDGTPDSVQVGALTWQLVAGAQGSVTLARDTKTDIPNWTARETSFYDDDTMPNWTQCTGDAFAFAAAGPYVPSGVPNTDPLRGPANNLTLIRVLYCEPPGVTPSIAAARTADVRAPLQGATLHLDAAARARPGTTVPLDLTAAASSGLNYQIGASLGAGPIPIDTRSLGLSPDALLWLSVSGLAPGVFGGFAGALDPRGEADASLAVPPEPLLIGLTIRLAFVTIDAAAPSGLREISPTTQIAITSS